MKSFLLLITLHFIVATGYSNKIDSLQTIEEALRFVTALGGHVTDVDSPLLKTDMDSNGLTDLLIKGDPLLVVMDRDSAGYKLCYIYPSDFISKYSLLDIDSSGKQKLLLLKTVTKQRYLNYRERIPKDNKATSLHKLPSVDYYAYREAQRIDSLVYKFDRFVEYNAAPPQYKIRSVRLATTSCLGNCPEYNLTVNNDRTADYNAGFYTGKSGHFTGMIDEQSFNELMQLVDYIRVQSLNERYAVDGTDYPTAILKVVFEDGQVKSISDYGMAGTQGLRMLYRFIDGLRTSQKWVWDRKIL